MVLVKVNYLLLGRHIDEITSGSNDGDGLDGMMAAKSWRH